MVMSTLNSCINFYEDGITVSLKTQKERLLVGWEMIEHTIDGVLVPNKPFGRSYYHGEQFGTLRVYLKKKHTRFYMNVYNDEDYIEVKITYLSDKYLHCNYTDELGKFHKLKFRKYRDDYQQLNWLNK